jgi:molybdopterin adenylyltransferase
VKAAVLTVSDGVAHGARADDSGALLEELLAAEGYDVVRRVVPDERSEIAEAIEELSDAAPLVLTTGGTGVAPRDVTPEATASVLERQIPGIRMGCSRVEWQGFGARRSSSTSPVRPEAVATGSPYCVPRSATP